MGLFFFFTVTPPKLQAFSQMNISSPGLLLHFEHKILFKQDQKPGSHLQNFPRQNSYIFFEVKLKKDSNFYFHFVPLIVRQSAVFCTVLSTRLVDYHLTTVMELDILFVFSHCICVTHSAK